MYEYLLLITIASFIYIYISRVNQGLMYEYLLLVTIVTRKCSICYDSKLTFKRIGTFQQRSECLSLLLLRIQTVWILDKSC